MVTITLRRVRNGQPPFRPDRSHIHHLFLNAGFNHRTTLRLILALDILFKLAGISLSQLDVAEYLQFGLFFVLFVIYACFIQELPKLISRIHQPAR